MKKAKELLSFLLTVSIVATMFTGCGVGDEKEKADSISVYLWSTVLYDTYAPYIQSQLPDVDIEFVVGNNDLDFYKFMKENGELPDIITCRRFSLHDAVGLQDQLMDLSTTEEAGAIYDSYLENFTNNDGTVNWLPICGEVDGIVANRGLFEKYQIPLPNDYESFVSACKAFEEVGIRGFTADFAYDYTCMEILQGLSIPEINSMEGQKWRHSYEDPQDAETGLDDVIWPEAFVRMEQFIQDTKLVPEDVELSYDPVIEMFQNGEVAMIRSGGSNTVAFQKEGNVDAVILPYFGENGEEWYLTYPAFQIAVNKNINDKTKREQALQVLSVMLSEEGQNALARGEDVISYSQDVDLVLSPALENMKPYIEQNHLYIRIASNEFFATSQEVVQKMLMGECNAEQAFEAFDEKLRQQDEDTSETILTIEKGYSNEFYKKGGNASASVMANSLRNLYGTDVLIAPAYSFTGSVMAADYTEKMVGCMIMPNPLEAWKGDMTGAQLKAYLKASVEGTENGFTPFNRGALPTVSGISIDVKEVEGNYVLENVFYNGKAVSDQDVLSVTCLNTAAYMESLLQDETLSLIKEEKRVKVAWTEYIKTGGTMEQLEKYITLK